MSWGAGEKGLSAARGERHVFGDSSVRSSGRRMIKDSLLGKIARRFSFWHYLHFIEKHVSVGARGLEFGPGGGNRWLASTYRMIGLEYGFSSAQVASQVYLCSINGDSAFMPFADGSFDFVCGCFVLEHFSPPIAQKALGEISRILREGGKFVALMDLHCDRPFLRKLRERYPEVYQEAMIDFPGHWGLVSAKQWHASVMTAGFETKVWREQSRFPISDLGTYACLASVEFAPAHLQLLGKGALWIASRPGLNSCYQIALTMADDFLGWIFPKNWAYRLLFVLEKP